MHVSDARTCMDAQSTPLARRKLLVFEEDKFLVSLMHMLLHREGFDLYVVTNEQSALDYVVTQAPPELLLISHKWLTDDYPLLIQRLQDHARWQDVPLILVLGYYDERMIEHALDLGINDYLVQPIEPGALLDIIQKYIRTA